jgi:3-dehydroquinate dehydratase-2
MTDIAVFNGPNLASLGVREPAIYGSTSAAELEMKLVEWGEISGFNTVFRQYDNEGQLVAAVNEVSSSCRALVINPGGLSHTSVAVLDAMLAFNGPVVEVHISQIHRREPYRHRMLTAGGADAVVSGAGIYGYFSAIGIARELLRR